MLKEVPESQRCLTDRYVIARIDGVVVPVQITQCGELSPPNGSCACNVLCTQ